MTMKKLFQLVMVAFKDKLNSIMVTMVPTRIYPKMVWQLEITSGGRSGEELDCE